MTGNVTMIKKGVPPVLRRTFVETPSAQAMLLAMRRARSMGKIAMIIADPGAGKTATMFHFRHCEAPESLLLNIAPGEGGTWGLVCALCELLELGEPNHQKLGQARRKIAEAIGPDGFLIIDEGQYLIKVNDKGRDNYEAFEWLRMVQEEGCFGLVIMGDTTLDLVLAKYPQLKRRIHPCVRICGTSESDVKTFCDDRGLSDQALVKRLAKSAKRYGGLGAMSEIFTTAYDMCNSDGPSSDDFLAAIQMLEGGL